MYSFEDKFFREATLHLCSHLEIDQAFVSLIKYLQKYIPVSRVFIECYCKEFKVVRFIATATAREGSKMDFQAKVSEGKYQYVDELKNEFYKERVIVHNDPCNNPLIKSAFKLLNLSPQPVLTIPFPNLKIPICINIISKNNQKYTQKDEDLINLLREPFKIAISNALKHDYVVRLKDELVDDKNFFNRELQRKCVECIVGSSFKIKQTLSMIKQVAPLDSPVLLLGETGVGKDLFASNLHSLSSRSEFPFIAVNCGGIPDNLIDSELFGHEKGAFTGALSQKRGRFERANRGTIFLDEIGELPVEAQVRLLRVLQNKEIERVGGFETIPLDIRVIAATNQDLAEMVKKGNFREDLWFRLNVFPIEIPPLRDRLDDIPALVEYFVRIKSRGLKRSDIPAVQCEFVKQLMDYHWPGNIRELQNIIERVLILNSGPVLDKESIECLKNFNADIFNSSMRNSKVNTNHLNNVIRSHIESVLLQTNGKIHGPGGAAEMLGEHPSTLRNRMKRLGVKTNKGNQSPIHFS